MVHLRIFIQLIGPKAKDSKVDNKVHRYVHVVLTENKRNTKGETASCRSSPIVLASKLQKEHRWMKGSVPKSQSTKASVRSWPPCYLRWDQAVVEGKSSSIGLEWSSSGEWRYRIRQTIYGSGHCRCGWRQSSTQTR
jgi:hypothetical protein